MRSVVALFALAAFVVADPIPAPVPGGVSSAVAPAQSPPAGCSPNYDGAFLLSPINETIHDKRALNNDTTLGVTLKAGILTDGQGRTGYIASNQQFQFDDPPQAGAIWTAGFTICKNGTLALGNDPLFYKCYNLADGFYNLYFESIGGQCTPAFLVARPVAGSHGGPASVPASLSTVSFSSSPATFTPKPDETHYGTAGLTNVIAASASSRAASKSRAYSRTHTTKAGAKITKGAATGGRQGLGASSASSSASATSSGGAMTNGFKGEAVGIAAGLLALAMA